MKIYTDIKFLSLLLPLLCDEALEGLHLLLLANYIQDMLLSLIIVQFQREASFGNILPCTCMLKVYMVFK